jgi:hypothetical protein
MPARDPKQVSRVPTGGPTGGPWLSLGCIAPASRAGRPARECCPARRGAQRPGTEDGHGHSVATARWADLLEGHQARCERHPSEAHHRKRDECCHQCPRAPWRQPRARTPTSSRRSEQDSWAPRRPACLRQRSHDCRLVVLVVAANPELERLPLIATLGYTVEDRVVAHQELDAAPPGSVGLVDGAILKGEDARSE